MYKNPIFGDNIHQKTIKSHPDIIFFQNSLKYSKYASISPTIFFQKIHPTLPVSPSSCYGSVENYWGIDCALLPNREWNQKQKPKKQPWSKVECFAFGGATVRFASLETSFHAANHTIPPPPSYEGYPLCTKDKNRSPFHGEKPLMIK